MAKAGLLFVGTDDGLVLFSDPGATGRWLRVGHELRGEHIGAIWPLFDDSQTVLAGGTGGMWRSTDGGASWQKLGAAPVTQFAGEKALPHVVEALIDTGWQRSDDSGASWVPGARTDTITTSAAPHASLAGQKPVLLRAEATTIARSDDDGVTWQVTESDQPWVGTIAVIAPARYHIDTAFAGSESGQLGMSSDRGRTWQIIKNNLPPIRAIVAVRIA